jgi:hypothetical protein
MSVVVRRSWVRRHLGAVLAVAVLISATALVVGAALAPSQAAEYYPAPASGSYTVDGGGLGTATGSPSTGPRVPP